MGGVWCKADKGQARSYASKGNLNSALSRWTDHVRQAYRKQKTHHRPTRPPQKPMRSNERLTISHPQLVKETSSDGWKTATLIVPEPAPVPPPRKKRKRNRDLTRTAFSMDDLNRTESLSKSTISLPDKCHSESGMDSRSSSSTLVVTPILESRLNHEAENGHENQDDNKENVKINVNNKIEEEDEDEDEIDASDQPEIIPIEKETLFSSRTLLHSNLGYIDKLSAISEVSTESGFEDKTDNIKSSDGTGSVYSADSTTREESLNILAHIQNITNVTQLNDINNDVKEKTAMSKKEWLQNILKEDAEPYFISMDINRETRRGSEGATLLKVSDVVSEQPNSLPIDHLHLMNRETEISVAKNDVNKPLPLSLTPSTDPLKTNHSVLLEVIQKNKEHDIENETKTTPNIFDHKEESIFLTNTKTNIIYKSLSSDKLTDDYDTNYSDLVNKETLQCQSTLSKSTDSILKSEQTGRNYALVSTNLFNKTTPRSHLSDYSFQTPKLVESDVGLNSLLDDTRSNVVSSFDFKELSKCHNYTKSLQDVRHSDTKVLGNNGIVAVNGVDVPVSNEKLPSLTVSADAKNKDKSVDKEQLVGRDSVSSSRRSSITDSLHEFEMSIYDMLKESKKNGNSSDEEDSLKAVK